MIARLALFLLLVVLCTPGRAETADVVRRLGHGVNVLGYDPAWSDPSQARLRPSDFALIKRNGFSSVRFNLVAFPHMDGSGTLDPRWLDTLDGMVAAARRAGLMVILDEHDFQACAADAVACRSKLLAFWRQIGTRYRTAPDDVLFELLNEPHGAMSGRVWNAVAREVLRTVRATNPRRTVVIGPDQSNSYRGLPDLELPDDPDVLLTIHYYDPFRFTHQGAGWTSLANSVGVRWGTPAEQERVAQDFATVAAWAKARRRSVLLGEFGVYDRASMADRLSWTRTVARAAEVNRMAWAYWQFEGSFGLFNPASRTWSDALLAALR